MTLRIAILTALLAIASILTAAEPDNFVFEIEGLTCEEGRHALEHIEDLEVDLFAKELTIQTTHGKYTAGDLKKVIDSTSESHGPMKGTLKKSGTSKK